MPLVVGCLVGCKTGGKTIRLEPAAVSSDSCAESATRVAADVRYESNIELVNYQDRNDDDSTTPDARAVDSKLNVVSGEVVGASPATTVPAGSNSDSISLQQVLDSVTRCYPEIEIAIGEIDAAEGRIISSEGQFDSILSAFSISQPLGFYKNYRNGTGISQPLFNGGEIFGTVGFR